MFEALLIVGDSCDVVHGGGCDEEFRDGEWGWSGTN